MCAVTLSVIDKLYGNISGFVNIFALTCSTKNFRMLDINISCKIYSHTYLYFQDANIYYYIYSLEKLYISIIYGHKNIVMTFAKSIACKISIWNFFGRKYTLKKCEEGKYSDHKWKPPVNSLIPGTLITPDILFSVPLIVTMEFINFHAWLFMFI